MKKELFERKGTIKSVKPYSVVIGSEDLKWSRDCGKRFEKSHEGQEATVMVDRYKDKLYIVDILSPSVKNMPASNEKSAVNEARPRGGYPSRDRFSSEDLELEKDKSVRNSRANALTAAIDASPEGTSVDELFGKATRFADFIQTGMVELSAAPVAPPKAPESQPLKPTQAEGKASSVVSVKVEAVKALWQKAEKAGWTREEFERLSMESFKKASHQLTATEFGQLTKALEAMLKAAIKVA